MEEVVAYWPALIDRREIEPGVRVEILEGVSGERRTGTVNGERGTANQERPEVIVL